MSTPPGSSLPSSSPFVSSLSESNPGGAHPVLHLRREERQLRDHRGLQEDGGGELAAGAEGCLADGGDAGGGGQGGGRQGDGEDRQLQVGLQVGLPLPVEFLCPGPYTWAGCSGASWGRAGQLLGKG